MRRVLGVLLIVNLLYAVWFLLQSDDKPAKVAKSADDDAVSNIRLVGELGEPEPIVQQLQNAAHAIDGREKQAQAASQKTFSEPDALPSLIKRCVQVGPYRVRSNAERLLKRAQRLGVEGVVLENVNPQAIVNWVMLPPYKTRSEARDMVVELQSIGLEGFVITEGKFENGVSLAMLEDEPSTERLLNKVLALGVDVSVERIEKANTRYALEFSAKRSIKSLENLIVSLLDDPEKLQITEGKCKKFASVQ